jgi:hypothetical protein
MVSTFLFCCSSNADPDAFGALQPKHVDALGVEIQKAFQRCSVPEKKSP